MVVRCGLCGERFSSGGARGRTASFCSSACRQRAYRRRKSSAKRSIGALVAISEGRWVRADGRRPLQVTGRLASSTDPATWSDFGQVQSGPGDGFGVMMGGGLACLDLDNALQDGALKGWAREAVDELRCPITFSEVSMSGYGVHVFVQAPEGPGSSRAVGDGRIEWFPAKRFIRCTFNEFII